MDDNFPSADPLPDQMVAGNKECEVCGNKLGLFPVAAICDQCRPQEQPDGRTIYGVAYADGSSDWARISTRAVSFTEDGHVQLHHTKHTPSVFLGETPTLNETDVFVLRKPGTPRYWVKTKPLSALATERHVVTVSE